MREPPSLIREIIPIHEGIKALRSSAHHINMLGLNAIIMANRAGDNAVGFIVLSKEFRAFSRTLNETANELMHQSGSVVAFSSIWIKLNSVARIMDKARALTGNDIYFAEQQATLSRKRAECFAVLSEWSKKLKFTLDDGEQLCIMGDVIARTARIEATHAGFGRESLEPLAAEFVELTKKIVPAFQKIKKAAALWREHL